MNHTSEAYVEMLNLKRFQASPAFTCSPEYAKITRERVNKALAEGAGPDDFRLAEGSLCALGWIDLFGNDSKSLEKAKTLMHAASKAWPGAKEVYLLQTHEAYAEMINLGRFKHGDCGQSSLIDCQTGNVFFTPQLAGMTLGYGELSEKVEILEYKKDSTLLILYGVPAAAKKYGDWSYEWAGKSLKLIKFVAKKGSVTSC